MINYLIVLFAITLIYFASAERLSTYVRLVALQGLLLCGIAVFELKEVNLGNLLFIVAETLLFKTLVLPYLLSRIIRRSGVTKVHRQAVPGFYLLLFSIAGLLTSVILAMILVNPLINTIYLAISMFTLITDCC
jgi:hydrogenase-4 component E